MNNIAPVRVRLRHLVAGVLAACVLVSLLAPPVAAQAPIVAGQPEDARVTAARRKVEEARRRQQDAAASVRAAQELRVRTVDSLDEAAAAYEEVNAQHLRLVDESAAAGRQVERARRATAQLTSHVSDRIVAVYKHPETRVEMTGALFGARDAATALHRAELVQQLSMRGVAGIQEAEHREVVTADLVRQQQVVTAGIGTSAAQHREVAADLTLALQSAQHRLQQAEEGLTSAEAATVARDDELAAVQRTVAEERAAAARAAAEVRRAAASPEAVAGNVVSASPLPPVDGKVCPIGAPNGFIDSWGYPRSGGRRHKGVDMFAAFGMPLYAVDDGVVRVSNNRLGGLSIHLTDDDGNRYYYAHLSSAAVSTGQRVTAGQVVGANGNSGNARTTPPHLHWEYHPGGGEAVNPYPLARALCR